MDITIDRQTYERDQYDGGREIATLFVATTDAGHEARGATRAQALRELARTLDRRRAERSIADDLARSIGQPGRIDPTASTAVADSSTTTSGEMVDVSDFQEQDPTEDPDR